jgi:hypothetical protein
LTNFEILWSTSIEFPYLEPFSVIYYFVIYVLTRLDDNIEVKVEPPLLSPSADSSSLDEPKVDHLLEESEDVEEEPNRLLKCFK